MNVSKTYYKETEKLLKQKLLHTEYEFEVRLCGISHNKKFTNINLDQLSFEKMLKYLTYPSSLNGLELKVKKHVDLDIIIENSDIRITLSDIDNIKKYWLSNDLEDVDYNIIKKYNISKFDLDNYSLRFSLSNEKHLENKNFNHNNVDSKEKIFRYKNRYSVITKDNLFKIDLTEVRQSYGKNIKNTNILKTNIIYEIELEYIGNIRNMEKIITSLFEIVNTLLTIYQDSYYIITNNEYNNIINFYNNLTKSKYFVAANPITLHSENLLKKHSVNILKDYSVTYKADGERNFLLVVSSMDKKLDGNIYLLNNNFMLKSTGIKNIKWAGSILEGEFISKEKTILLYDILFQKNKDIRNLPLLHGTKNRHTFIKMFLEDVKSSDTFKFEEKTYFYKKDDIFKNCKDLLENEVKYSTDGLIFTPTNKPYPKTRCDNIYKWKPPLYNSIDFLIEIEKENGEEKKKPFIHNKKTDSLSNIYQCKIVKLKVSGFREKYNNVKNIREKVCVPIDFPQENICYIPITEGKIYAFDKEENKKDVIKDDQIIEFIYNKFETIKEFRWKPIRVRYDKTYKYKNGENMFGNFETVALDIWKSIQNPITAEMLITGDIKETDVSKSTEYYDNKSYNSEPNKRLSYQRFHTQYVKNNLLKETVSLIENKDEIKLMDIGYGKLGDIPSWKRNNISFIFGFDNNENNFELATQILQETPEPKPQIILTYADYGKLIYPDFSCTCDKIAIELMNKYLISKNQFDIVSSQFSLSYFWENDVMIKTLLQNVNDSLKIGGFFVGTCFNGKRVMEILEGKKETVKLNKDKLIWSVKKLYRGFKYNSTKPNYNKKIEVFISSFGKSITENIINIDYFIKLCSDYKLELVKNETFESLYDEMGKNKNKNFKNIHTSMTDSEKEFSFLNDIFIFKKTGPSPTILLTKLKKKL